MQAIEELNLVEVPKKVGDKFRLGGVTQTSLSLVLAKLIDSYQGLVVAIVPDFQVATSIEDEVKYLLPNKTVLHFPDWEILPYDSFSPHQDIISERISTLAQLEYIKDGVLIVPVSTLMHKLAPKEYIQQNSFLLKCGQNLDLDDFKARLANLGYTHTNQVMEHGEFVIRGSIVDVFPMGHQLPFRIDLFDDEVDTIRVFDVETQRTINKVAEINILPAREFPMNDESITEFRSNWRSKFEGNARDCQVYQDVTDNIISGGLEYFLPLFFKTLDSLFEYLPENCLVARCYDIEAAEQTFQEQYQERYDQYRHDITRPILAPEEIFLKPQEIFNKIKQFSQIVVSKEQIKTGQGRVNLPVKILPNIAVEPKLENKLINLKNFIDDSASKVIICAESRGRREIIKDLLKSNEIGFVETDTWQDALVKSQDNIVLIVAPLINSFWLVQTNLAVITESELFGKRVLQKRRRKTSRDYDSSQDIKNLSELSVNSPIVHIEHGVGRYLGLTMLNLNSAENEFLTIEYARGDKLYVPVQSLHLISRYSGAGVENAPLHSLGSDKWGKEKRKAREKLKDIAAELLGVYAKREAATGFIYQRVDDIYQQFAASFPFEETPDQVEAINSVIADMYSTRPMDRVVCGDVGFGKTEVAMRAAFIAAQNNKQVAVLVPTTLLAQQHYQTFADRFADFPVKVDLISRFRTKKEQDDVIAKLSSGNCDIVIGTHKLILSDINFKNLGLLIIDEEHRFGVKQKEKFKALRSEVDILTMTATPIPRTLNMAMNNIRDLSIIGTPPLKRLAVKTFVREYSIALIKEAVTRELRRGGQVFFLHNSVDTIMKRAQDLQEALPEARIVVAHGQMRERELEQVMSDFYHKRYNVLVCTTIIETGIDIPTANTIIMERADKLGLAQLHQLRGRVGRSHHQAYAFCLTPTRKAMTSDAIKRLDALESLDTLGAGFTLATHDLEIRGAGELLGDEQSGNINSIGFSLYMELLDLTVKALKEGKEIDLDAKEHTTEVDLQIPSFLPDKYIHDIHTRLILYKRIASAKDKDKLDEIKVELVDRFGLLPDAAKNLFAITELKIAADKIGVKTIKAGNYGGKVEFNQDNKVNPQKMISLIQSQPNKFSLDGPLALKFKVATDKAIDRISMVDDLLANFC